MVSAFGLTPVVSSVLRGCYLATAPSPPFLPELYVGAKVTRLVRGRSSAAVALSPGDEVVSLETSFSWCWLCGERADGPADPEQRREGHAPSSETVSEVVKRH